MAPLNVHPMLVEEPIRLAAVLEPSHKHRGGPVSLTKIVGTVGGKARTVDELAALLQAGMAAARFDFSFGDLAYHMETLANLKAAMKRTDRLCAVVVDTAGPEVTIVNKCGKPVQLQQGSTVTLRSPQGPMGECPDATPTLMWFSIHGLAKSVEVGGEIFVGQYLFTGSEATSVWLKVKEVTDEGDVVCEAQNSATLCGNFFTVHVSQVRVPLPTLRESDKAMLVSWLQQEKFCDVVSLSFARTADDVLEARQLLDANNGKQVQVFAKIENLEGLQNFDAILGAADGIILGRGDLGIDLPPEKVFLFQKEAIQRCNWAGKPVIISRVVDTMTDTPRPTRAEATDVANAVLDGVDAIMLGAETLRGLYPVETITTVAKICAEAEKVYDQDAYFKAVVDSVPGHMSELESICCSAVTAAENVHASCIVVFTITGDTARMLAKYRPSVPALLLVVPTISSNQLSWTFTGEVQARQSLLLRGTVPMLAATPSLGAAAASNEAFLKGAVEKGKAMGIIKPRDKVVLVQKLKAAWAARVIDA